MHREAAVLLEAGRGQIRSLLATETVYLSGYVVECSLKAYLLSLIKGRQHGGWVGKFEASGHDLEQLLRWLAEKRRQLPHGQEKNCRDIRKYWSSQMRYEAGPLQHSVAEKVHRAADAVFHWVLGA